MNTCLFSVFVLFAFVCFLRVYVRMPAINHVFVKLVGFFYEDGIWTLYTWLYPHLYHVILALTLLFGSWLTAENRAWTLYACNWNTFLVGLLPGKYKLHELLGIKIQLHARRTGIWTSGGNMGKGQDTWGNRNRCQWIKLSNSTSWLIHSVRCFEHITWHNIMTV